MFRELDPLLHTQVRLAIMSLLVGVRSAEFSFLLENTGTTKGNLSFQLTRLKEAGYVRVSKSFRNNYPLTVCSITEKGIEAYEKYIDVISEYFKHFNKEQP